MSDIPPGAMPLVSVVLPTFNRESHLRQAITSVLEQTYTNWELVIVDDGSTDGTRSYLAGIRSPRIRVLELEHSGLPARVRNAGLRVARGTYVAFLDSDDYWHPSKLAVQVADLAARPGCGWSYTYTTLVDDRGAEIPHPRQARWQPCAGWILEDLIAVRAWVATPAVLAKRSVLEEVGGFEESLRFYEDYDLWLRLSRVSPASVIARPLVAVRRHAGSMSAHGTTAGLDSLIRVYDRLIADPTLSRVRWLCRRRRTRFMIHLAAFHRAGGNYRRALGVLGSSLPWGVLVPGWWGAALKTMLRPLTPGAVLRGYRAGATWLRSRGLVGSFGGRTDQTPKSLDDLKPHQDDRAAPTPPED